MSTQPNPILQSTIPGLAIGDYQDTTPGPAPEQGSPVYAIGLLTSDGDVLADDFAQLTGNLSDDVSAISVGTGVPLPVALFTAAPPEGNITGTLDVDFQFGSVFLPGLVLTGNLNFVGMNAVPGSILIAEITANGHTVTDFAGTTWPGGTKPTPSGGVDAWGYRVVAVSAGVPTVLRGAIRQNYS